MFLETLSKVTLMCLKRRQEKAQEESYYIRAQTLKSLLEVFLEQKML